MPSTGRTNRAQNGTDDRLIDRLSHVFQAHGYEGASLSLLAQATGLQRASLYHRFPGGKQEMAQVVLDRAVRWLSEHALGPLSQPGSAEERIRRMTAKLDDFYDEGRRSCLLDTLSLGRTESPFHDRVRQAMGTWIEAMAQIARETGSSFDEATRRAEEALVQIQGGLVLARGTGDRRAFHRALDRLPSLLLGNDGTPNPN